MKKASASLPLVTASGGSKAVLVSNMNLQIFEAEGPRWQLALDRLVDGFPFEFRGVTFGWSPHRGGSLEILVRSTKDTAHVTAQSALADLDAGRQVFNELESGSGKFAELASAHPLSFALIHDYGTGSVEICRLAGNELVWAKGFAGTSPSA